MLLSSFNLSFTIMRYLHSAHVLVYGCSVCLLLHVFLNFGFQLLDISPEIACFLYLSLIATSSSSVVISRSCLQWRYAVVRRQEGGCTTPAAKGTAVCKVLFRRREELWHWVHWSEMNCYITISIKSSLFFVFLTSVTCVCVITPQQALNNCKYIILCREIIDLDRQRSSLEKYSFMAI